MFSRLSQSILINKLSIVYFNMMIRLKWMLLDTSVLIFYVSFVLYGRNHKRKSCKLFEYYKRNCNSRETKKLKKNYIYIENDIFI